MMAHPAWPDRNAASGEAARGIHVVDGIHRSSAQLTLNGESSEREAARDGRADEVAEAHTRTAPPLP